MRDYSDFQVGQRYITTTGAVVELIAVQHVDLPGYEETVTMVTMVAYQFVGYGQRSNELTFMRHINHTSKWTRTLS